MEQEFTKEDWWLIQAAVDRMVDGCVASDKWGTGIGKLFDEHISSAMYSRLRGKLINKDRNLINSIPPSWQKKKIEPLTWSCGGITRTGVVVDGIACVKNDKDDGVVDCQVLIDVLNSVCFSGGTDRLDKYEVTYYGLQDSEHVLKIGCISYTPNDVHCMLRNCVEWVKRVKGDGVEVKG